MNKLNSHLNHVYKGNPIAENSQTLHVQSTVQGVMGRQQGIKEKNPMTLDQPSRLLELVS